MSEYQLIAFDMDGTLLNSQKQVMPATMAAVDRALEAGKIVTLCTGRGLAELGDYPALLARLSYVICTSGAMVYQLTNQQILYSHPLAPDQVDRLLDFAAQEGAMPQLLTDRSIVQRDHCIQMARFGMGVYQPMYQRVTDQWENIQQQYQEDPFPVCKCNLYHTDIASRDRTEQRIRTAGMAVEMVHAEKTSLEISAKGVDKGSGLEWLCSYLSIPLSQTIAVGDANNDWGMFQKAGLAIAMGNAIERIQSAADVVVADCDHDGCAQAIDRYLL